MDIIQEEYIIERSAMTCGSYEAEKRRYHKYIGESGRTWLVADQLEMASNIYVSDPNPNSQGFGGRTLTFETIEGEIIKLQGPWHSNASALYRDTKVDVRDKHLTFVVVALDRGLTEDYRTVMKDVIYIDNEPMLGSYDRGKDIAQEFADKLNRMVFLCKQTSGGPSHGPVYPSKENKED